MGSEARLEVLRCLVRAGRPGLSVGDIGARTGIAASTLAHHLRQMADAGLIAQEKSGRSVMSRARFDHLETLAQFILVECCVDTPEQEATNG